jgi:Bacterial membrane protein YfhO
VPTLLYLTAAVVMVALARRVVSFSLLSAAVLVMLPLVFTGRALLTGRVYAPIDLAYTSQPLASMARAVGVTHMENDAPSDVYAQFVPWNAALRWSLAHHEWPLWNPFELGGGVLAAAAQSAPYHPLTLLGLVLPQVQALTFEATILFFVAALTMFLLARDLELAEVAAIFAAAAWAFSTHLVTFAHTAHGNAVAMMPLVMLAARRVARDATVRNTALLTLALTLLMLCGHPESMLHVVFLSAVFALFEMRSAAVLRTIGYALAAGLATLLLTAIFVLPMFDAISQTREYLHRTGEGDPGFQTATPRRVAHLFPQQFVPFVEGRSGLEAAEHTPATGHPWAGSGYAGALAFAPAMYALWRARRRTTWFFAAVVVFGWLIGLETPGIYTLFRYLPLFSIAINARMIAFAALGTSMLAAIGLDAFLRDRDRQAFAFILGGTAATMAIAVAAMTRPMLDSGLTQSFIRLGATRELLPLLLAFAACCLLPSARAAGVALVVLLLIQRGGEAGGLQPTVDPRAFYPPIAGLDHLPRDDAHPYRVVGQATLLPPDIAAHYELEDVRGYQAMTFVRLAETFPLWCQPQPVWSNRVDDLTAPFLSLMNVRYALATADSTTPAGWEHRGSYPGFELLENRTVLPRAFIPAVVHEGVRPQDAVGAMAKTRDFGTEAWIEDGGSATRTSGAGRITIQRRGSHLRLGIDMATPGWVVVSEPAWRGWRAIDGDRPLELHFADAAFLAFHLDAGSHDVRLFYRPQSFVLGAAISVVTALAMLAMLAMKFSARQERPSPQRH